MTNYTLTSPKLNGHLELQFTDGHLNAVKMVIKAPLSGEQFCALMLALPQFEKDLYKLEALNLSVTIDKPANEKIALFCRLYESNKGIKYKVSPADSGKIKLIKADEDILVFYFGSSNFLFRGKHSISNLVKYYNELLADIAAGAKPKVKYPDHFDQAFQNKLTSKECPAYWNHLRSLGLMPKKDRVGNTIDWIKTTNN
jgi:hypothetical protein